MKWFFRSLNLLVAVIAVFLLYQHFQKPLPPPPHPPGPIDQPAYPETVPAPVIELIESFNPSAGKYDDRRIARAIDQLDDGALTEVLQSLAWDSEAGQELFGLLAERKLVGRDDLKNLEAGTLKDLAGVRKCFTDQRCFPALGKCLLDLKCCIFSCRCWPLGKDCGRCCFRSCCSKTIQVGLVGGSFKTVKKIRFDGNFSVALDGTDTGVITLAIPDNSINGAKIADNSLDGAKLKANAIDSSKLAESYAPAGHGHGATYAANLHGHSGSDIADGSITAAKLDTSYASQAALSAVGLNITNHIGTISGNPHQVSKADLGLDQVLNVEQLPKSARGAANGVAALDAGGKLDAALLAGYALETHDHAGSYAATGHLHNGIYAQANELASHLDVAANPNPHNVTKAQVGLGNVDNLQQLPMTAKGQANGVAALDAGGKIPGSSLAESYAPAGTLTNHLDTVANPNPHNVTKAQVGLGNVDNLQQIPMTALGVANGVATLDANSNLVFDGGNAKIYGNGANSLSYSFSGTCRQITASAIGGTCNP